MFNAVRLRSVRMLARPLKRKMGEMEKGNMETLLCYIYHDLCSHAFACDLCTALHTTIVNCEL